MTGHEETVLLPVYGVFLKNPDKDGEDVMVYMAYSEEAAEAKIRWHANFNGNFRSQYYYRRVDQQEYTETGELLYRGDANDEGII